VLLLEAGFARLEQALGWGQRQAAKAGEGKWLAGLKKIRFWEKAERSDSHGLEY
jgi:hypothetical protein